MNLKLVMSLLVRNEIDIVRQNMEFHLAHGVDHVIATDNGSVDGTREILSEFERLGVATVLDEPGHDFSQGKWVTRMALMARDRLGADWILHNDADEFWVSPTGQLKSGLASVDADILVCGRRNMVYAYDDDDSTPWPERLVYRVASPVPVMRPKDYLTDELPCPYFYFALPPKVLTRAKGLKTVRQGNHWAIYDGEAASRQADIAIYHFPVRSVEQFRVNVRQNGEGYVQNTDVSPYAGWHSRRWYRKLIAEGPKAAMSEALPSASQLERERAEGVVVQDLTMRDLLRELHATR
ncbi:MAG: glycosyltransferase family 2 protein [Hyphomicrobiales bacterium]|nr:glycosyltransferase family 2 protein [Hyphomicrobiales bacterium]